MTLTSSLRGASPSVIARSTSDEAISEEGGQWDCHTFVRLRRASAHPRNDGKKGSQLRRYPSSQNLSFLYEEQVFDGHLSQLLTAHSGTGI